jgi:hypothetical protein
MHSTVRATALGNKEVCEYLEKVLATAKEGKMCMVVTLGAFSPTQVQMDMAGHVGSEFALYYALDQAKAGIVQIVKDRQRPAPKDSDVPANMVEYNLTELSTSYDFLKWLIVAEMKRVEEGAPPPLRVKFFYGASNKALEFPNRAQMFHNVMVPLVQMIGAVVDDEMERGRQCNGLTWAPIWAAYNKGQKLPQLMIPPEALVSMQLTMARQFGDMPVTITLRESDEFPHRNSDLLEWIKFAEWLRNERNEHVLFVRDTAKAEEGIEGFHTLPIASQNLIHRAALYEVAKANLFVSNGPSGLGVLSAKPSLLFQQILDDGAYWPETARGCSHFFGFEAGKQWPIPTGQRIIWKPDTFENIRDAWIEHMDPVIEKTVLKKRKAIGANDAIFEGWH